MKFTHAVAVLAFFGLAKRHHIILAIATFLGVTFSFPLMVQADDNQQASQGLPGRRVSGGSRSPSSACAQNRDPMVAIVPETNLGATAVAEPTLWLGIPEITTVKQLEFYLFNTQDEIIYQTHFVLDSGVTLVGLDLATMTDAPKLEIEQRYRWAASIVCDPNNRSEDISVEGWVDRVEASNSQFRGLWYDRLDILLEQLQRYPQDQETLSQWRTLMTTVRLEHIVPLSVEAESIEITAPGVGNPS